MRGVVVAVFGVGSRRRGSIRVVGFVVLMLMLMLRVLVPVMVMVRGMGAVRLIRGGTSTCGSAGRCKRVVRCLGFRLRIYRWGVR